MPVRVPLIELEARLAWVRTKASAWCVPDATMIVIGVFHWWTSLGAEARQCLTAELLLVIRDALDSVTELEPVLGGDELCFIGDDLTDVRSQPAVHLLVDGRFVSDL